MAGDDEVVMVNNTYKDALESARSSSVDPAARLEDALSAARRAMDSGAWEGPMGEDFSGELDTYRTKLNDAGPAAIDALDALDAAIVAQPERVTSTAWQVRWQRMGPR
ncbi:hypothetical protein [Serinicoccus marinus]|uniref:hypothetical protein n=1 Tax=Serinicoccus marinus TaxID=247333 RepID=UPI0003B3707E|nr:hypothetical protein [Serinicoccus marinus]